MAVYVRWLHILAAVEPSLIPVPKYLAVRDRQMNWWLQVPLPEDMMTWRQCPSHVVVVETAGGGTYRSRRLLKTYIKAICEPRLSLSYM